MGRNAILGATILTLALACSSPSSSQQSLPNLCKHLCDTAALDYCDLGPSSFPMRNAIVDITNYGGCDQACPLYADGSYGLPAACVEAREKLLRCVARQGLDCGWGHPPQVTGCDDLAIAATEACGGGCRALPSGASPGCNTVAPDYAYCSISHPSDPLYCTPARSPDCWKSADGGFCCPESFSCP